MPTQQDVSNHYTHGNLAAAIRNGIEFLGKTVESITVDDLAPVDEFHIGGRQASEDFLGQLELSPEKHVLDVGCGLGGAARFVASRYGCRVTGIDLTPEFVETARVLCRWVGLDNSISLHQGSALAMPFADRTFDCAYMLHAEEAGFPWLQFSLWAGLFAPKGTPRDIIDKLNAAAIGTTHDPAMRQKLIDQGFVIPPREQQTPEALGAYQKAEIAKWWPIIKAAGTKAE